MAVTMDYPVVVVGAGLVGQRCASMAASRGHRVLLVSMQRSPRAIDGVVSARGWPCPAAESARVVVLATATHDQFAMAKDLVSAGVSVVSTADNPVDVTQLWTLDALARSKHATLVVGSAYSPGVSTLLASYLARSFDDVSAISTARFGTGGPACAREHHRSMNTSAIEVHDGLVRNVRAGSGRQLVWFPEPAGAADCYRAGLADPFLLRETFPGVRKIDARQAATRRDRLTARLPMLRPPHAEGLAGAVWAEVRGVRHGAVQHRVMAATAPQATGAAAMAAAFADMLIPVRAGAEPGVVSAASVPEPGSILRNVAREVRLWTYAGAGAMAEVEGEPEIQAARKWRSPRENRIISPNL